VTFSGAIQKVHDEIGQGWKDKARAQFLSRAETHAKPHLGAMRVNEIEAHHVIDALSPIWIAKPATAKKVRNDIMQVLDFAKSRGWRLSPVPTSREISKGLPRQPKAKHHKAMPYAEIPAWFEAEAGKNDSPARLALMFAVLTGARSGEVRGATWAQIKTAREEWVRSADDMKSDRAHTVALNKAAMAVLKRAEAFSGDKGHIFPNSRGTSLSDAALSKLLRMSKRTETVHGFRSSLRDFAAEKLPHIPDRVAEAALAHSTGDRTVQAYLRSDFIDMRRQLMEAWGQHVAPSLAGEAGNVVQMQVAG
jgi:integrase